MALSLTAEVSSYLFWIAILSYAGGLLSAFLLHKHRELCKKAGFGLASLASLALLVSGVLAVLGFEIKPIAAAAIPQIGTFAFGVDALSGFFAILIGLVGLAISIYSFSYMAEYERKGYNIAKFVFLFNVFLLSMAMVVTAQNALAFLVFWETMALSSFYLVSFEHKEPAAKNSGFIYLLMTHLGTACLIGMFILLAGGAGGSFDFSAFADTKYASIAKDVIFVLALIGFGVKAGIMPFHIWLPIAHPKAPSNISALMSGVMLKTAIYGIVRVLFGFLAAGSTVPPLWWGLLLLGLGAVSGVLGVLYSLMEHDIKVLLAYHSIENIGIILTGIGAAVLFSSVGMPGLAALALFAALYHTLNHALFKSLLFSGAGAVINSVHTANIDELGGLVKLMPATAFLFFIGAASIAAIPPLNGFASEWLTFSALLGGVGATKIVSLAVMAAILFLALTSALALAAFAKAFGITFLGAPRSQKALKAGDPPKGMIVGMAILAIACVVAGIFPGLIARIALPALVQLNFSGASGISSTADSLPTFGLLAGLLAVSAVILLFLHFLGKRFARVKETGPTWDCGVPATNGGMQYSAKGFTMPVLRAFDFAANPLGRLDAYGHRFFEALVYRPLLGFFQRVSPWSRKLHTGKLMHYLAYLLVTLILVVTFALTG